MKTRTKLLIIFSAIIISLVLSFFFIAKHYLTSLKKEAQLAESDIEEILQERSYYGNKLVSDIYIYPLDSLELRNIFNEFTDARLNLDESIKSGDMVSISRASNALDTAIEKVISIPENFVVGTTLIFEDASEHLTNYLKVKLFLSKKYYNKMVTIYNDKIQEFPFNIVAKIIGYHPMEYFNANIDVDEDEVPKVNNN